MIKRDNKKHIALLRHCMIGLLLIIPLTTALAEEANDNGADKEGVVLNGDEIAALEESLGEMQNTAPKLRVMLRSVRTQVGIDTRQVFNIERSISQAQKDIGRLIAMHRRGAVNRMRAHFLADDMRRKAEALRASLAYLVRRAREFDTTPGGQQESEKVKAENDALVEILGTYSAMLDANLAMIRQAIP